MKTLLTALLVLFALSAQAQSFNLIATVHNGVIFDRNNQSDQFTAQQELTPELQIDKLRLGTVLLSYTTSTTTGFMTGMQVGYEIIEEGFINGRGLFGNTGTKLAGLGLQKNFGDVTVSLNAGYEFSRDEKWLDFGVGYLIFKGSE